MTVTVEIAEENLDDFSEHLLKAAEEAVESGEKEIMFRGIRMTVSRAQIMGMKCLRNKLIQKTKDSLEKRFLSDEIEVLTAISKILLPSTNPHLPLDKEIEFLSMKYPISLDKASLHSELKVQKGLKKAFPLMKLKTFAVILVGNHLSLIPNCGFLAQMYLLAPVQNAVVERTFSFQNLILSARRNRLSLDTVGKKILMKYCKIILTKEEITKIIESAAVAWLLGKNRRKGSGTR